MSSFLRYGEEYSYICKLHTNFIGIKYEFIRIRTEEIGGRDMDDMVGQIPKKRDMQKFVRYSDGAKMYSMGKSKFQELAKEAKACYKVGHLVLVNTEVLEAYLEKFHIEDDAFYK